METRHCEKKISVSTNMDAIEEKVIRLKKVLEEANSIIEELASMNLEVNIDI